jgi:hypothetical protein
MTAATRSIRQMAYRTMAIAAPLLVAAAALPGPMQTLLAKINLAASPAAAANDFVWNRESATPAGALAASFAALNQALDEVAAKTKALRTGDSATMVSAMPAMSDPKAMGDLQKKMEKMSDQEKMALALQMTQQMTQGVQQTMTAQMKAAPPSPADEAVFDKLRDLLAGMQQRGVQLQQTFISATLELERLRQQWPAPHASIDSTLDAEMGLQILRTGAFSYCDNSGNGQHNRQILLKYADQHIALADRQLAQLAQWSTRVRGDLSRRAEEDDVLMQTYGPVEEAAMRTEATRLSVAGNVVHEHEFTLIEYIQPYAKALRDAERDVAVWVHARDVLQAAPLQRCS